MNQRITLQLLVTLLRRADRVALILGIVAVAAAYYGFTQYREVGEARDKLSSIESRVQVVEDDLAFLRDSDEAPFLQQKLEVERSKPELQSLPSKEEAGEFSSAMISYAAAQDLTLGTFERSDETVLIGETEFSSIHHSMAAQGNTIALIGMLQLLSEFPTAKVLDLAINRIEGSQTQWTMGLELDVFYLGNEGE